jgi:hypothetical protein
MSANLTALMLVEMEEHQTRRAVAEAAHPRTAQDRCINLRRRRSLRNECISQAVVEESR